jgi:GNAT superfamily N-acetyltransferase
MAMYNVQEETNLKVLAECLKLGELHYDEVFAHKKEQIERNYNWQFLKICLDNNLMHIVTARDDDNNLIGYFVDLVSPDMFSSTFVAKELAIFVHPDHRGNKLFGQMLNFVEDMLRENGVTSQMLAFQKGFNEELPLAFGYRPTEVVYEKVLLEE